MAQDPAGRSRLSKAGGRPIARLAAPRLIACAVAGVALVLSTTQLRAAGAAFCITSDCTTQQQSDQYTALQYFIQLYSTPEGQTLLEQNATVTSNVYLNSTEEERTLAVTNSQSIFTPHIISAHIWEMVEQPGAQDVVNLLNDHHMPESILKTLGSITGEEEAGGTVRDGVLQIDYLKTNFATYDIYGQAYGTSSESQDPRPFLVIEAVKGNPWCAESDPNCTFPTSSANATSQADQWSSNSTVPSFPSGHSMVGFATALYYAALLPTYYQDLFVAAEEFGYSRNVLGVHYALDVIGGRIAAMVAMAHLLGDDSNYSLDFRSKLGSDHEALAGLLGASAVTPAYAACSADVAQCIAAGDVYTAAEYQAAREAATYYLTYDLPSVGDTTLAPRVPEYAIELIRSRFPYMGPEQLHDVLASTELPSGVPLDDGTGWARLNLYAAVGGYGAFTSDVTVTMDASKGGLHAFDIWSNDISGVGGLIKEGTGTLLLAGDNTYAGGTTVNGGTLALTGTLKGDLTIAQGASFLSAGGYYVDTDATLANAGTFTTIAANPYFSSSWLLNLGSLSNDGMIEGEVRNYGVLSGTGTIDGALTNAGVLSPGHSIGTVTVTGPVAFTDTSVYVAETGAGGTSDLLAASGLVTLDGKLVVLSENGTLAKLGDYTVISSATGFAGAFDEVTALGAFLDADVAVEGSTLVVSVTPDRQALATAGGTANTNAVGRALGAMAYDNPVLAAAVTLDAASAPAAFASLTGEIHASAASVLQSQSVFLRQAITGRLASAESGVAAAAALGYVAAPPAPGTGPAAPVAWGRAYGGWGQLTGGSALDVTSTVGGFFAGADAQIAPDWRVGVAGGLSHTGFSGEGPSATGESDNYDFAAYAGGRFGAVDLKLAASYTWHDISTRRVATLPGPAQLLEADQSGGTAQLFGELAYGASLMGLDVSPFAGLAYVRVDLDGYAETGGAAALSSAGLAQENVLSSLGVRAARAFAIGTSRLDLRAGFAWQHAFGTLDPVLTQSFITGGAPFAVSGAPIARDVALVDAGLEWLARPGVTLGAFYAGQLAADAMNNSVQGRLSFAF